MAIKVVDASALAAIMFKEPQREAIVGRLEGATLVAPTLLHFEIVNACVVKLRRQSDLRDEILAVFDLQVGLGIETAEVDHSGVLTLAERFRLTGYDASYLWLAERLNAELVTLDGPLARAAATLRPE